jgi:1,3-beta-glucanosyltransferase GAS1
MPLSNTHRARFTRQGTPTPVTPDFFNLKARWAAVSPSGVALSTYSGVQQTPRPCPPSTVGWAVDASLPLPTLGQVETPLSSSVMDAPNPTVPLGTSPTITSAVTRAESAAATSATAQGGATRLERNVLFMDGGSVTGCVLALLTLGLVMLLLL